MLRKELKRNWYKKSTLRKKKPIKPKKVEPAKFDKEGFYLGWGLAIVMIGVGSLIIWAVKTAPKGGVESTGYTVYQRLAHAMPQTPKEIIAIGLGGLFILFGIFCFFLGVKIIWQYIADRFRN